MAPAVAEKCEAVSDTIVRTIDLSADRFGELLDQLTKKKPEKTKPKGRAKAAPKKKAVAAKTEVAEEKPEPVEEEAPKKAPRRRAKKDDADLEDRDRFRHARKRRC